MLFALAAGPGGRTPSPPRRCLPRPRELTIFLLSHGTVCGAYILQADVITADALLLSLPHGFLVAGILIANEVPDAQEDQLAQKRTLVVRMGAARGYLLYALVVPLAAAAVVVLVLRTTLPLAGLLAVPALGLPATVELCACACLGRQTDCTGSKLHCAHIAAVWLLLRHCFAGRRIWQNAIAVVGAALPACGVRQRPAPRQEADVHLFDRNASTTMLPELTDVAGGRLEPARIHADLRQLLKPHIQLHLETVQSVDPAKKTLSTAEGVFTYDFLVLTCGAVRDRRGLDEHQEAAYTLGSLADAERICQDFTAYVQSRSSPQVLVVGGGYTGLELASNLKLRSVRLGKPARVTVLERKDRFLAGLPNRIRSYLETQARRQGIEIRTVVKVDSFDGRNVQLSDAAARMWFLCCSTGPGGVPECRKKQETAR